MFDWLWNRKKLSADSKLLGKWGERRCEKFLMRKGLKTLARNYSCRTGELDLVMAQHDGTVVFVEVKTRTDESYVGAESALSYAKKQKLLSAARYFLSANNIHDRSMRFDYVTVILGKKGKPQINHYENAFCK